MEQENYKNVMDNTSEIPVPKYYRLKMDIITKINSGLWAEHEKLPSENILCEQYGISRTTVRKTFDALVASKYIYKIQGKGTYVEEASKRQNVVRKEDYGCSEMIRRQGMEPAHKVLRQEICPSDAVSAECLHIESGNEILNYVRVYYGDGIPVIFAKTAINIKYLRGLSEIDLSKTTLSEVLKNDFGLTITPERCVLRAISADEEMSSVLDVPKDFPLLYRAIVCTATNGVVTFPVETSQLYFRTDCMPIEIQ